MVTSYFEMKAFIQEEDKPTTYLIIILFEVDKIVEIKTTY